MLSTIYRQIQLPMANIKKKEKKKYPIQCDHKRSVCIHCNRRGSYLPESECPNIIHTIIIIIRIIDVIMERISIAGPWTVTGASVP